MAKLLVVDDEQSICWGLTRVGERMGHQVRTACSAEDALRMVAAEQPDAIVLDVRLPGIDGLQAMDQLRQYCQAPIIVTTAFGDLQTAVAAVRNGAFEYLTKPFELEKIQRTLSRALSASGATLTVAPQPLPPGMIGSSPAMQELFRQLALVADSNVNVLILGESGSGKELAARAIHRYSPRSAGPFIAVNIASLSPSLAESELFGHARGAFTGAEQDRIGLLAQADGGTLFLDEVADIPLALQVKLLRALEHDEVTPVGSQQPVKTNFRVVSATHQDLLEKVHAGDFRHDLYFRLGAFRLGIPPLRQRREDIAALANHFLLLAAHGRSLVPRLSDEALLELQQRAWFGNVRELRNAIEHAVIVARGGVIDPEHLPDPVPSTARPIQRSDNHVEVTLAELIQQWTREALANSPGAEDLYQRFLAVVEPPLLKTVFERHSQQYVSAARTLGLHRTTLRRKLDSM